MRHVHLAKIAVGKNAVWIALILKLAKFLFYHHLSLHLLKRLGVEGTDLEAEGV